jgi:hypothetical protein
MESTLSARRADVGKLVNVARGLRTPGQDAGRRADRAMSPAGRHFIMLDDPAWFEATLQAFIK